MVVVSEQDGSIDWRAFIAAPAASLYAPGNWSSVQHVGNPQGSHLHLLGGFGQNPSLAYTRDDLFAVDTVRRFDGSFFGAPGGNPHPDGVAINSTYAQSPNGTIYAFYSPRAFEGDVRVSTDGGATFGPPAIYTCDGAGILPRAAVNDAGQGFVRTFSDDGLIVASRITDRPVCGTPPVVMMPPVVNPPGSSPPVGADDTTRRPRTSRSAAPPVPRAAPAS